jgi:serine/threonine-protein kinase
VFAVQDEISAAIAGALLIKLSPPVAGNARHIPTLPAHEALLKARHYHWKVTPQSMAQAKEFYQQAIALDPRYALAHALYADWVLLQSVIGITPANEAMPAARALAERALQLDSSLSEAHAILCAVASTYDYDWNEAARRFTLATCNDAASPWCHFVCGLFYFLGSGRKQEAVDQLTRAVQGDPLNLTIRQVLAYCLGALGRHAEAEEHLRQNLELNPQFHWSYAILANILAARQMFNEALTYADKAYSIAPWFAWSVGTYAGLLARTSEGDRGLELVQGLRSGELHDAQIAWMIFHCYRDEIELAVEWAEKAVEARHPEIPYALQGVIGEPLRASPFWPKLAAMMNLPAAPTRT